MLPPNPKIPSAYQYECPLITLFCLNMETLIRSFFAVLSLASAATAGDVRHTVAIVDDPAKNYLSICGWEFDVEGGGYSTCSIDLDGDGLNDRLFANAATSGTGGQAATVYLARKDGKFTRIGSLGHGAITTETIKTGGKLLHCSWSFGGGATSITTYLVSHEGLKKVMGISGEWKDLEYQKRFEEVFSTSLKLSYKFVASRPIPAEQESAPNP